jgi:phosphoribosylanthranilate isomerase
VSVRVKICGVTNAADAALAVEDGADLIGLNFYPRSPRCVALETAREIRAVIPANVLCVGVFVNADRRQIASLIEQLQLDVVQFHGDEQDKDLVGWSCQTIKAVRIAQDEAFPDIKQTPTNYILLDTYKAGRYGGTGETFAWERIVPFVSHYTDRIILAGGLTPENVSAAVQTVRPWAVDVASGVEAAPGRKDPRKLRAFIANAKNA